MKLRRLNAGFIVPISRSRSRWIGWYNGNYVKGYKLDNGQPIGYREFDIDKFFFI